MEDKERLRRHLGLEKSIAEQYWKFLSHAVRGDLGKSISTREPVIDVLFERGVATFQLGIVAFGISILIAVPAGVYSAVKRGTFPDMMFRVIAISGQSIPVFWLGLMLILLFGVILRILPTGGAGSPLHLILPSITLGWYVAAGIMRLTRTSMLEVLRSEYIQLARAKGVSEQWVIWRHGFKNAALPVLTFSVLLFVMMLGGAVVTETVFAWPGLGRLVIQSVMWRDYPVVQGVVLLLSTLYILGNLLVDILYAYLNPKIRYGG
jgi:ABC-type dipeptide/oligopeptide/nickel transport system permease component